MRNATDRRKFLLLTGAAVTTSLAGCSGADDDEEYQEGNGEAEADEEEEADADEEPEGEEEPEDDEEEDEEEELDEEEVEQREEGTDVLEFGDLVITEHELHEEEGDYSDDIWVEGVVENQDDEPYDSVTVAVRAYNADGQQLDRYLDTTSDLQAGGEWAFEVTILEDLDDFDDFDIAVTGHQF
jgi:hypothetical protein